VFFSDLVIDGFAYRSLCNIPFVSKISYFLGIFYDGKMSLVVLYPTGIGFPVFPVTYPDIFHFFLRSLIPDKLPEEEK
jgi:hypothetical protein